MGAFGYAAPRVPLATAYFGDPAVVDPGATSAGPAFAPPNKPPAPPAPRQGLFGGIRAWLTPERLARLGAGLRQVGGVNGALGEELQRQMEATQAASRDAWQRQLQQAQIGAWNTEDKRNERLNDWAATQGPEAQIDPAGAYQAFRVANAPLTRDQTMDNERQARAEAETERHNRASEGMMQQRIQVNGAGVGGLLTPESTEYIAQQVYSGGAMPTGLTRSPRSVAAIQNRVAEIAAQNGQTGQAQVARAAAVRSNQSALTSVTHRRTLMEPAEEAARRELALVRQYSDAFARTGSPAANVPLSHLADQMRGNTQVIQLRNAARSAATEYARVLSGSTGAAGITDSARTEADSMINENMTPAQIVAAIATMEQGMRYKNQALLDEEAQIRGDLGQSQATPREPLYQRDSGGAQTPQRPPGVPAEAHWDAARRMWVR